MQVQRLLRTQRQRLIAILGLCLATAAHAGSSANYTSFPETINAGGGTASSANYVVRSTLGQSFATGTSTSASYSSKAGFWHMGPGGVLVGANVTTFGVVLEGAQEVPVNGSPATGSGTVDVDTTNNTITLSLTFSGLSSAASVAHLHGPAARGAEAGPRITINHTSPVSQTVPYDEADEADILNGLWYVNVHTANFPGGEIRGQLDNLGAAPRRLLTVSKSGTGTGLVTSDVGGIDCGGTCTYNAPQGLVVTLTASPTGGGTFTGWTGACSGTGQCVVTMDAAKTVTATFNLDPNPPRLSNISTRMQVRTGNDVMIGGFVIGGSASKTVVVRARGPSLIPFGITNALANPTLRLVRASDQATIATNDDWQQASNAADLTASGFAPDNNLESALLVNLAPGAYTAVVSGVANGTGVGIVEVFEVDGPQIPLANISTRGQVLTGNDVMIGGFVITGSASQTVVVRARGPSLIPFGITNALANPTLRLVRSSNQQDIAVNDDWQQASNAADITASGFAPDNSLESAILVTLPPGAYTAIVSGVNGGTGVGIVEVFRN